MPAFLPRERMDALIAALRDAGYRVVGPRHTAAAISYGDLERAADLPHGLRDSQTPGRYRLETQADARCFAWAAPVQSLKPFFFTPTEPLWRMRRTGQGFEVAALVPEPVPLAVIGARACDLAALAQQDRILHGDPHYNARRHDAFLVAVNCTHPAETCFCASAGTGPRAAAGFDLSLTELDAGFLVETGSERGERLLHTLALDAADMAQRDAARTALDAAAARQTRHLPAGDLSQALYADPEHPRWADVAQRCLACGNCTQACPTCFCHARAEEAAPDGQSSVQLRRWDSCFGELHGHLAGYQVRPEIRHRYRQWLTHKLGSWWTQFGQSGCVGCGRCITWCPAGIDLTEEVRALLGDTA